MTRGNREYALTFRIKGETDQRRPHGRATVMGDSSQHCFEEPTPILVTNPDGLRIPLAHPTSKRY